MTRGIEIWSLGLKVCVNRFNSKYGMKFIGFFTSKNSIHFNIAIASIVVVLLGLI